MCPFNSHISLQPDQLNYIESGCRDCGHHIAVSLDGILFSALYTLQMLMTISLVLLAQRDA